MNESSYSLRGQYAGFVSRLIAYLIDRGIIIGVLAIVTAISVYLFDLVGLQITTCHADATGAGIACGGAQLYLLFLTLGFAPLYSIVFWTLAGQTPGKYFLGLRVYRLDGEPLTLARSTRRYIGYILSFLAFGLGFLWITVDNRRQGFHDKFANTCVVYSWDAFQNQRLIARLSHKLFKSRLLQNPEAFYGKGISSIQISQASPVEAEKSIAPPPEVESGRKEVEEPEHPDEMALEDAA